jgi:hypothetical protein
MEINGKIIELLPEKTGESGNGPWRKQEYILETEGQYPKKVCFMAWGDKIDQFDIKQGEILGVSIDLESREFNGRWYTDVKVWKVSRSGDAAGDAYSPDAQRFNDAPPSDTHLLDNDVIPF